MAKKSTAAAARTPDLSVSKSISRLERVSKADVGGLFKALVLAATRIGTGGSEWCLQKTHLLRVVGFPGTQAFQNASALVESRLSRPTLHRLFDRT